MRARRFQPLCDRLDSRLLLDASGMPPQIPYPGDEINLSTAMAAANPVPPTVGYAPTVPNDGTDVTSTFVPPNDGTMYNTMPVAV